MGAFQDAEGRFTLANFRDLFHPTILKAYWISIQVSAASAHRRRDPRLLPGVRGDLRRAAAMGAADAPDVLRRGLELRRGAARLRVPRHARADGAGDRAPGQPVRLQHLPDGVQPPELLGSGADVHVLPDPAHGPDHGAGDRRAEARVARGGVEPRRERGRLLAVRRAAGPVADPPRHDAAPVRQRLRRDRDGLRADRQLPEHRHDPAVRPDPRRRAPQPEPRVRAGPGDDR